MLVNRSPNWPSPLKLCPSIVASAFFFVIRRSFSLRPLFSSPVSGPLTLQAARICPSRSLPLRIRVLPPEGPYFFLSSLFGSPERNHFRPLSFATLFRVFLQSDLLLPRLAVTLVFFFFTDPPFVPKRSTRHVLLVRP